MANPRDPPNPTPERRAAQRHPVIAPIVWTGGKGITENISTTGVYFVTAQPLRMGQMVAVTIQFAEEARRSSVGRVVRVEPRGTAFGVALELPALPTPVGSGDGPTSG